MKKALYILVLLAGCSLIMAATHKSERKQPAYAWLEGRWVGDGFGGISEEVWSAPSRDDKMMGIYRHHNVDGKLNFYEFIVLDEAGMRLKHFSPNLKGWEEKDKHVTFKMVTLKENIIEMEGMVYKFIAPNKMEIHLQMRKGEKDGKQVFQMTRK